MELDYEKQFYTEVLVKLFQESNHLKTEFKWACYKIIDLMNFLNKTHDKNFVKNALILIITMFMDYECDYLMNMGLDIKDSTNHHQKEISTILKTEFLLNFRD